MRAELLTNESVAILDKIKRAAKVYKKIGIRKVFVKKIYFACIKTKKETGHGVRAPPRGELAYRLRYHCRAAATTYKQPFKGMNE